MGRDVRASDVRVSDVRVSDVRVWDVRASTVRAGVTAVAAGVLSTGAGLVLPLALAWILSVVLAVLFVHAVAPSRPAATRRSTTT